MKCRICGCTDTEPCLDLDLGITCGWAEDGLCTFCFAAMQSDEAFVQSGGELSPRVEIYSEAEADAYLRSRA